MMSYKTAFQELKRMLREIYPENETNAIAKWVIQAVTQKTTIQLLTEKDFTLSERQQNLLGIYQKALSENMPVQYVLNEVWFAGSSYYVDRSVLIPRPETEELVEWVFDSFRQDLQKKLSIIDIGTGSGCIAISLKKMFPNAIVEGIDISPEALSVANKNTLRHSSEVSFYEGNILDHKFCTPSKYDIIISNPPYIPIKEKHSLDKNVSSFEPEKALFVPDDAPLIFYEAIATFANDHINENGNVFLEIHQDFGEQCLSLFEEMGWNSILKKDMYGNFRMIKLWRNDEGANEFPK